jgi:xylan 1,4-beta-xylosidase
MTMLGRLTLLLALLLSGIPYAAAQRRTLDLHLDLEDKIGPMNIDHIAGLAQGGLSPEPYWSDRVPEIRAIHPKLIRFFTQSYFNVLPAKDTYDWKEIDAWVEMIRKTGAEPLMDIVLKPRLLFPKLDPAVMSPTSWAQWDALIYHMALHYKGRIHYWEVGDECELGEDSGCPYQCTPENYVVYYKHTVEAILRADPQSRVGGPTVAQNDSKMLPALLNFVDANKVPLHFVSWHRYDNDPQSFRKTIEDTKAILAKHPSLHPDTYLGEWNMDLFKPPLDPQFQPAFITEVIYQMKEGGLDYGGYYQIRDYHIDPETFAQFMTPAGVRLMTRWWNGHIQVDGLFDYQNRTRPSYFAFTLLSHLTGERLRFETKDSSVHGMATWDDKLGVYNILVWNFSPEPVDVQLTVDHVPSDISLNQKVLDANAPTDDENVRLRPFEPRPLKSGQEKISVSLGAYGIHFLSLDSERH